MSAWHASAWHDDTHLLLALTPAAGAGISDASCPRTAMAVAVEVVLVGEEVEDMSLLQQLPLQLPVLLASSVPLKHLDSSLPLSVLVQVVHK